MAFSYNAAPGRIVIARRGNDWQINLTADNLVWSKKRYVTPAKALAGVARHLDAGHTIAFANAYRALTQAAAGQTGGR